MRFTGSCAVLVVASLLGQAAVAQNAGFPGNWSCKMGNQPAPGGSPYDLWLYTFDMELTGQGNFSASGTYEAATNGYAIPFTLTGGTWEKAESGIMAKGTAVLQGEKQPFSVAADLQTDGSLTYSTTSGYGTLSVFCTRR